MMATSSATGGSSRDGTAKAMVADQISQAVQSTSNLLHLMQQSSPAEAQFIKLPKNLLAKASTIKNTEQVLEQMPGVISSLDAHMENGLQSVPHLKTVIQLLANMENCQLNSLSQTSLPQKTPKFHIGSLINSNGRDLGIRNQKTTSTGALFGPCGHGSLSSDHPKFLEGLDTV